MKNFKQPFLWNFIKMIENTRENTEAQERVTESANEENSSNLVKLYI